MTAFKERNASLISQIALLLMAILFMYLRTWRRGLWLTGGAVLIIALCDQSSAHWLKPVFERVRPCHAVDGARVLIHCTQAYSFPSAHATNTFGAALWFSYCA